MVNMRGQKDETTGITEGKMRTLIKSDLRQLWRNSSRKEFIKSVRFKGINPKTEREWFCVSCADCGIEMGVSEKARRTKKDGTLEKRMLSVYEINHINGITPMTDIKETLGDYYHSLIYGKMEVLCVSCHKKETEEQRKKH